MIVDLSVHGPVLWAFSGTPGRGALDHVNVAFDDVPSPHVRVAGKNRSREWVLMADVDSRGEFTWNTYWTASRAYLAKRGASDIRVIARAAEKAIAQLRPVLARLEQDPDALRAWTMANYLRLRELVGVRRNPLRRR